MSFEMKCQELVTYSLETKIVFLVLKEIEKQNIFLILKQSNHLTIFKNKRFFIQKPVSTYLLQYYLNNGIKTRSPHFINQTSPIVIQPNSPKLGLGLDIIPSLYTPIRVLDSSSTLCISISLLFSLRLSQQIQVTLFSLSSLHCHIFLSFYVDLFICLRIVYIFVCIYYAHVSIWIG